MPKKQQSLKKGSGPYYTDKNIFFLEMQFSQVLDNFESYECKILISRDMDIKREEIKNAPGVVSHLWPLKIIFKNRALQLF